MESSSVLGLHRVMGQPGMMPQAAERVDALMPCQSTELEIATDFARAALSAEGMGSAVTPEIGNGLYPGHADLAIDLLRRHPAIWGMLTPEAAGAALG